MKLLELGLQIHELVGKENTRSSQAVAKVLDYLADSVEILTSSYEENENVDQAAHKEFIIYSSFALQMLKERNSKDFLSIETLAKAWDEVTSPKKKFKEEEIDGFLSASRVQARALRAYSKCLRAVSDK